MTVLNDPFSRLITTLEPWLGQIVIIGGWAHQLYRRHPDARQLDYSPLTTIDTDVALPRSLLTHQPDIRARLLAGGFKEEFFGDDHPPATHYHLGSELSGFYVEFLTPLVGSEYSRNHKRKTTIEISGVVSQQLRYIEILLQHPWTINFPSDGVACQVNVANPAAFIAQKVLIHAKRGREDRAKDILYLHDTFEVFGARLPELRNLWQRSVTAQLHKRDAARVARAADVLFADLTDDIRRASQISAERHLTPNALREACRYGFTEVFG